MKYKDFKKLITSNQGKFLADDSVGDYHIFLVKWLPVNVCEVGISYKDMPFMFPSQQEETSGQIPKTFMHIAKDLLSYLVDWVDLFDEELIRISSHNYKKLQFYYKIINHYLKDQVYTTEIIKDPIVNYFIISKNMINMHIRESLSYFTNGEYTGKSINEVPINYLKKWSKNQFNQDEDPNFYK